MIHPNASALGVDTPQVNLMRLSCHLPGRVVAKLEMRTPAGSMNDRSALATVDNAKRRGALNRGGTFVAGVNIFWGDDAPNMFID